jgi:hypothetical protein
MTSASGSDLVDKIRTPWAPCLIRHIHILQFFAILSTVLKPLAKTFLPNWAVTEAYIWLLLDAVEIFSNTVLTHVKKYLLSQ